MYENIYSLHPQYFTRMLLNKEKNCKCLSTFIILLWIFLVIERCLQYTGRKHYFILCRGVVGIHCGRTHTPTKTQIRHYTNILGNIGTRNLKKDTKALKLFDVYLFLSGFFLSLSVFRFRTYSKFLRLFMKYSSDFIIN